MTHEARYNAALEAIQAVHADQSLPLLTTHESLSALREEAESLIDAIECDLAAAERTAAEPH